ncbi:DNA excision repair protein ERCC-1-like [Branchiostoma floridae]|uniref:DNA excision repair protein ERCC-1 n=1 Tax=Branchiostoma floridae TaxID=7739 RepID=A0A9J7N9M1_BRAFL|nr:DNA excision repair protein ERCC-1-like [Branchiostoma floridae]XP_035695854.1 DNA excision repair protein ERCC-1-like [Branchiostoma floridae]
MADRGKKFNIPNLDDVYDDTSGPVRSLFKAGKTVGASRKGPITANNKHAATTITTTLSSTGDTSKGNVSRTSKSFVTTTSAQQERSVSNGVTNRNQHNISAANLASKITSDGPSTSGQPQASKVAKYDAVPSTSNDSKSFTGIDARDSLGGTMLAGGSSSGPNARSRTGSTFLDVFGLPEGEHCNVGGAAAKAGPAVPRTTKLNSIVINPRQKGNPVIKNIRNVAWEFGDVIPDYVLGKTSCALFLSLRYHHLHPNYIQDRLQQLGRSYMLRILLVQVDVADPHHSLKELAKMCILADCTLILAWSAEEAGKYLETYKAYESKPADLIKEKTDKDYLSKATDFLTTIRSVNKTDVSTLVTTFRSIEGIIKASKEDLALCPGFGPQKAKRVYDALHQPFLRSKKPKPAEQT